MESFAQTHGMSKNTTEACVFYLNAGEGLNYVIVHKADTTDLVGLGTFGDVREKTHVWIFNWMIHFEIKTEINQWFSFSLQKSGLSLNLSSLILRK